ncbi:MAG TPA: 1-aminocyclopropane-1-carboxylate deaminase/D-cysteine desulfhydrase [Bacteroidetes bacterium]|nr:1-aminocyclopropane-1-carboxylate deaminase/D-cysteine desulfhydrase [Bacteroidota bacterium]
MTADLTVRLQNGPSPVQEICPPVFAQGGLRLFIKRDDLLHPDISGNKWRKLKYNLIEARRKGFKKLLTYGGAYSNHLAATAAAGKAFGFSTLGVVRGEKVLPLNPTLMYVEECGMELKFVSRTNFRNKNDNSIFETIKINPNGYYDVPIGGSNCLALPGCAEIVAELNSQLDVLPDYICTACGTGGTLAGIVTGMEGKGTAIGISALKGNFMKNEVAGFLKKCSEKKYSNWQVFDNYHFGGFAKFKPELIDFINSFKKDYGIPLDPIYTGKLAFALFDLAGKGFFEKGATVVMVHTGGLQGVVGFNERFGGVLKM